MDKIKPRTLSGFMELPPDKQVQMDKMRAVLAETYARYGFTPLDTGVYPNRTPSLFQRLHQPERGIH